MGPPHVELSTGDRASVTAAAGSSGRLRDMAPLTDDHEDPVDRSRGSTPPGLLGRARQWLDATPLELLGLIVLLAGAIALTAVVVWQADRRPSDLSPAARVGAERSPVVDQPAAGDPPAGGSESGDAAGTERDAVITVHVSGAVASPGVVTLDATSRVADAIAAVGGTTPIAEPGRINLARRLVDGERVHVPHPGEDVPPGGGDPSGPADGGGTAPIDLNRATREQLEALPGIGPAKAEAIIAHREAEGPFAVPGDLRGVPGIGERTFQQLADLVTVR